MPPIPKDRDELIMWIVLVLAAAVAALFARQVVRERSCESRVDKLTARVDTLTDAQIIKSEQMAIRAYELAQQAEKREKHLAELATNVMQVSEQQKEALFKSVKMLMRFDKQETNDQETIVKNIKPVKHDDETSAIFRPHDMVNENHRKN